MHAHDQDAITHNSSMHMFDDYSRMHNACTNMIQSMHGFMCLENDAFWTCMHIYMLQAEGFETLPDTVPGFEEMEMEHQLLSKKKKELEKLEQEIAECEVQVAEQTTRCHNFEEMHDAYVTQVEKTRDLKAQLELLTERLERATEAACTSEGCSLETQEMLNRTAEDLIAEQDRLMFQLRGSEQSERDKHTALQKARDEATDSLRADKVVEHGLPKEDLELLDQLEKQAKIRALRTEALEVIEASNKAKKEEEKKKKSEEMKRLALQEEEEKEKAARLEALRKAQEREEALRKAKAVEEEKKKLEEANRAAQELELKRAQEEEIRKAQELELKRAQEEEIRKAQELELKRAQEEEIRKAQELELKRAQEEEIRKAAEAAKKDEEEKKKAADAEIAEALRKAAEKEEKENKKAAEAEALKDTLESKRLAQQLALNKAQEEVQKKLQELEDLKKAQEDEDKMQAEAMAASETANQQELMKRANIQRDLRLQEEAAKVRLEREQEKARFRTEQEKLRASPKVDENMVTQLMRTMNISKADAEGLLALQNMQKQNMINHPPPEPRTGTGATEIDRENAKRKIQEIEERTERARKKLQMTKEREAEMKLRSGARSLEERSTADTNEEKPEGPSERLMLSSCMFQSFFLSTHVHKHMHAVTNMHAFQRLGAEAADHALPTEECMHFKYMCHTTPCM